MVLKSQYHLYEPSKHETVICLTEYVNGHWEKLQGSNKRNEEALNKWKGVPGWWTQIHYYYQSSWRYRFNSTPIKFHGNSILDIYSLILDFKAKNNTKNSL